MGEIDISYTVKYSDRKTLGICVERDGSVIVRAPLRASEEKIGEAVQSKRRWIWSKMNHSQKLRNDVPKKRFVKGEGFLYLGRKYKLDIIDTEETKLRFRSRFLLPVSKRTEAPELFSEWYRDKAKEKIVPRAAMYAKQIGVAYKNILVSDLDYRWGSCTAKGNLHFNWHLIKAPLEVIDYLIVHELAHLLEPNHSERFWVIIRIHCPHFEKAIAWLRDKGEGLMGDW